MSLARIDSENNFCILALLNLFYFQGYAGGGSPSGPMPPPGSGGPGGPPTSRPSGPPNSSVPSSGPPGQPPMPSCGPGYPGPYGGPMYPGNSSFLRRNGLHNGSTLTHNGEVEDLGEVPATHLGLPTLQRVLWLGLQYQPHLFRATHSKASQYRAFCLFF